MEIGFHLNEVNPALLKNWPALTGHSDESSGASSGESSAGGSKGRVLVPLCGKTIDIIWLLQQGYEVVGAELSRAALEELAEDISKQLDLELSFQDLGDDLLVWQHPLVSLYCGDFFELTPEQVGNIDWVYDRGALVALPEDMRKPYTRQIKQLADNAVQLLVAFEYDQNQHAGPPFSIPQVEVHAHYGAASVELLSEIEAIESEPKFKKKGLDSFVIRSYRIQH
ncbi:MAG: thiopurine S-methyltransferase [Oceanobacter sp.]